MTSIAATPAYVGRLADAVAGEVDAAVEGPRELAAETAGVSVGREDEEEDRLVEVVAVAGVEVKNWVTFD